MFMTDSHILIGMNKSGGAYGWLLMMDTCGGGEMVLNNNHVPIRAAKPGWLKGRRVIGLLRNPFAWYVSSWWHEHLNRLKANRPDVTFENLFWDMNKRPWHYLVQDYQPPPPTHVKFSAYTFIHLNFHLRNALNIFRQCRSMAEVERMYDDGLAVDDWVRGHTYYEDFARILGRPVVLKPGRSRNAHPHGPHKDYYTAEMRRHVEKNDAFFMQRYGYTWDGPAYESSKHQYPPCPSDVAIMVDS